MPAQGEERHRVASASGGRGTGGSSPGALHHGSAGHLAAAGRVESLSTARTVGGHPGTPRRTGVDAPPAHRRISWWRRRAGSFRTRCPQDVRAWRKDAGLPRFVQVGAEDELLPVDLDAATAAADLAGQQRVFEIWPPLGDTPDSAGRRLEVVVALADVPDPEQRARIEAATAATRAAGAVPPPRRLPEDASDSSWQTFKLFGAADRQDALLVGLVAPLVTEARAAGELEGWFFLRYLDGPRTAASLAGCACDQDRKQDRRAEWNGFSAGWPGTCRPQWRPETSWPRSEPDTLPESARFGGPAVMGAVHQLFEADSDLTCALLAGRGRAAGQHGDGEDESQDGGGDDDPAVVAAALADRRVRRSGARPGTGRRPPRASWRSDDGRPNCRARALTRRRRGSTATCSVSSVRACGASWPGNSVDQRAGRCGTTRRVPEEPPRAFPPPSASRSSRPLLHLLTVRLMGPDRSAERRAYDLWARTLDSLDRHQPR